MAAAMWRDQRTVRFGTYTVNLQSGELHRNGVKIKVPEQSFQILSLLLGRPGEVVTREEIQHKLWPDGTFVDFEHSLNAAVKRLREALGDSAEHPRFVETLPRRGYRFIHPVEGHEPKRRRWVWGVGLAAMTTVALLVVVNVGGIRDRLLGQPLPGDITSIAVLPLDNLSGDPEQEYFADGIHEALITELGKISALRVISRQSVMRFKDSEKSLPEIARELNVDAAIEGSAVREGDRVRITIQLIRAKPEQHLWAESYERDFTSTLGLQGEMARAISRQVRAAVTPEEEARLASAPQVTPGAYTAYLKGRYFWNKRTPEDVKKALEYFQEAIEIEPDHAAAYSGLADSYVLLENYGTIPFQESSARRKEAVAKALEIDDTLAEAHTSLAIIKWDEWDWQGTEREFKRAIELNPSSATAHYQYALYLVSLGRLEQAGEQIQRAQQLDPLSLIIQTNVGYIVFHRTGQYDEAIAHYRKVLEMDPAFRVAHAQLGWSYVQKGLHEQAIGEFQQALVLGRTPTVLGRLGYCQAVAGRRVEARKIIDELKGIHKSEWDIATVYVGLNEMDQAFHWLEEANKRRDPALIYLKADPMYDPLRDDPRFHSLLRRMNFPE